MNFNTVHFKKKYMTIKEVAGALCLTKMSIRNMVFSNNIKTVWQKKKENYSWGCWLIDTDSLSDYLNELNK